MVWRELERRRFIFREAPAVTVAIAKQAGTNAVTVADGVIRKVEEMKGA